MVLHDEIVARMLVLIKSEWGYGPEKAWAWLNDDELWELAAEDWQDTNAGVDPDLTAAREFVVDLAAAVLHEE